MVVGLRLRISNRLPGDVSGAGPWTTLGGAKMYRLIHFRDANQEIDLLLPQNCIMYLFCA